MRRSLPAPAPVARAPRSDGAETRRQILEVAGALFADMGYARTTAKAICARAGTNTAAVNYHFGSKEGLYEAVLIEAHRQIVSLDVVQAIADGPGDARHKLRATLQHVLRGTTQVPRHWGLRLLMHELMAPSRHATALVRQAVLPKLQKVAGLVADMLELPPGDPAVQRALAMVVLPCISLVVLPPTLRRQALPALDDDPQLLNDEMIRYALAGLAALRDRHRRAASVA